MVGKFWLSVWVVMFRFLVMVLLEVGRVLVICELLFVVILFGEVFIFSMVVFLRFRFVWVFFGLVRLDKLLVFFSLLFFIVVMCLLRVVFVVDVYVLIVLGVIGLDLVVVWLEVCKVGVWVLMVVGLFDFKVMVGLFLVLFSGG